MGKKRSPLGSPGADRQTGSSDEAQPPQCHHAKKSVDVNRVRKALALASSSLCAECDRKTLSQDDDQPWLCLACGTVLCGRNSRCHALQHYEMPRSDSHALALQTRTWTVFCYSCRREVKSHQQQNRKLHDCLEQLRRALDKSGPESSPPPPPDSPVLGIPSCARSPQPSNSNRRVRGLANLGNTCYFNSVLQCLAQTPYLIDVLKDAVKPGERIKLPGGKFTPKPAPPDPEAEPPQEEPEPPSEMELPIIRGELPKGGNLTKILADTLVELKAPGRCDTYSPRGLLNEFVAKVPQFDGGDQHDSHELLRHLLEAVRSEDLRRYQLVVLHNFDYKEKRKAELDDLTKQKIKYYGQQATDSMLRPGQVFRGLLVSTLECQDCKHSSHTTEYFLDLSLPVTADKPLPPAVTRRKMLDEQTNNIGAPDVEKSKHQLKKEKQIARKLRKICSFGKGSGNGPLIKLDDTNGSGDGADEKLENKSSSEQSDADVEDNVDDYQRRLQAKPQEGEAYAPQRETDALTYCMESGYNSEKVAASDSTRESPVDLENKEKSDLSPERTDKDGNEGAFSTVIALPYKSIVAAESPSVSNPDSGVASPETAKRALSDVANVESPVTSKELGSPTSFSSEINMDISSPRRSNNSPVLADSDLLSNELPAYKNDTEERGDEKEVQPLSDGNVDRNESKYYFGNDFNNRNTETLPENTNPNGYELDSLPDKFSMYMETPAENSNAYELNGLPNKFNMKMEWREMNYSNRNGPSNQRNLCDEGEYSIQSCLNQFTSSELLTGNNKVGCEACTKRANNNKTVYTNATKRFCISNPPAVLILHLKRFQLGSRCILRKITKTVNFPLILDLGPFSEKARSGTANPNKILYSLYGVVEHSGNTLHLGHYVAYVKVRPEVDPEDARHSFMPANIHKDDGDEPKLPETNGTANDNDTDSSLSGYESGEGAVGGSEAEPPAGKWYSISDSRVTEVSEEEVLKVQAYLLFYERIL